MAGRRSLGVETISISHDDPLRDLFEACKHGDVSRVSIIIKYGLFVLCRIQYKITIFIRHRHVSKKAIVNAGNTVYISLIQLNFNS